MPITYQNFFPLTPLLILASSVLIILFFIIFLEKNNKLKTYVVYSSFIVTLIFLLFIDKSIYYKMNFLFLTDNLSRLNTILIVLSSLVSLFLSQLYLNNKDKNIGEFYILIIIIVIGCIIAMNANNMCILFIGIELISLTTCGLIGINFFKKKHFLETAIKYIIFSSISSVLLLFGMSLIYTDLGSLNYYELINNFALKTLSFNSEQMINHNKVLFLGFTILIISMTIKLSFIPFHFWNIDVCQGNSYPIILFLNATNKIAIFTVLTKFFVYLSTIINQNNALINIITLISCISILLGNIMLMKQKNIKRFLSYSSIAHFGYLLAILTIVIKNKNINNNYEIIVETIIIYLLAYLLSNVSIFNILSLLSLKNNYLCKEKDLFDKYHGLFWKHPFLCFFLTISFFSLAGIPITLGFIGKLYIFNLIISNNLWFLTLIIFIGNIIGLYSYFKTIIKLYLISDQKSLFINKLFLETNKVTQNNTNINSYKFLILSSGIITLFLGINPQIIIFFIQNQLI